MLHAIATHMDNGNKRLEVVVDTHEKVMLNIYRRTHEKAMWQLVESFPTTVYELAVFYNRGVYDVKDVFKEGFSNDGNKENS